jgi:uncharacterized Zn ribbon protein|tara:strand:- start:165 stop:383 length:219 start_codon:yes stop_codon:yes gene_type:complete
MENTQDTLFKIGDKVTIIDGLNLPGQSSTIKTFPVGKVIHVDEYDGEITVRWSDYDETGENPDHLKKVLDNQ